MSLVDQPREQVVSIPATTKQPLDEPTSPSYRTARSASGSSVSPSHASENDDSDFTDSLTESEYDDDEDMESKPVVARAVPALPVKSSLRSSRMLDDLAPLKMDSDEQPVLSQAPPHAVYLSSEEDASSSADDFSDFDFESDVDDSPDSPSTRSSHEIVAHTVEIIFHGRPSMIEVAPRSPDSISSVRPLPRRTTTETSLPHQSFVPEKPTRYSTFVTMGELEKSNRPGFLQMDPFPSPPEEDGPPKSPAGARFKRTFSLARKRTKSITGESIYSQDSQSTQTLPIEQSEEATQQSSQDKQAAQRAPANYQDILTAARRNSQSPPTQLASDDASSVTSPSGSKSKSRLAFLGRRRGVKA